MKRYSIVSVEVPRYPVVRIRYNDGFEEDMDFTSRIETGPIFEPLKDPALFATVGVGSFGGFFGWRLDQEGEEIDLCADGVRYTLEEQRVRRMAETYRQRQTAAE